MKAALITGSVLVLVYVAVRSVITEPVGLGDVVASIISGTTGIPPCEQCAARKQLLNDVLTLKPWRVTNG